MTAKILSFRPNGESTGAIIAEAQDRDLRSVMIVGVDKNGDPYWNASGDATLEHLAWMSMLCQSTILKLMTE